MLTQTDLGKVKNFCQVHVEYGWNVDVSLFTSPINFLIVYLDFIVTKTICNDQASFLLIVISIS